MPVDPDELLNRQFRMGKPFVQCTEHVGIDITQRPANCVLCHSDQRRTLIHVLGINQFLVQWQNDAKRLIEMYRRLG